MKRISAFIAASLFLFSAASVSAQRQPKYISPNNDGVQDSLDVPLRISDRRYVVAWSFVVENEGGSVVRTIGNKLAFAEKLTFKSFWKRLFSPKKTIDIPSVVSWNGVMDNGETAPDGIYYYYFTAVDDNGNVGKTDKYTVVVDTTPPSIALTQPADKIFGEGSKATFAVRQSGSKEDEWKGIFAGTDGTAVNPSRTVSIRIRLRRRTEREILPLPLPYRISSFLRKNPRRISRFRVHAIFLRTLRANKKRLRST